MSRLHANSSDLEILASALSTIPGSRAIRVRKGQKPTQADAYQNLLYALALMAARQRGRRVAGRSALPRTSAA